jgi:plasmid segregation protein ParM
MKISTRFASVDIGNDALKGIFGGFNEKLYIPNVVAKEEEDRKIIELEKDTLNGLHVKISSPSLSNETGIYVVGNLATGYDHNDRMGIRSVKAESDQSLVVLLTALAVDAVKHFPSINGACEANFLLSTGLPLDEVKDKKKKVLKQRLMDKEHVVTFLQTPKLQGKTVKIIFSDVLVNGEGYAAFLDLTTDDALQTRNGYLKNKCIMINDIGGVSTDTAVFKADGEIHNKASQGLDEGTLKYLQEILEAIDKQHKVKLPSLQHVLDVIQKDKMVLVKGRKVSAEKEIIPVLEKAAKVQFKHIENTWEAAPELEKAFLIGGGSALLKEYILELNKEINYPLEFIQPDESVWMIARAYWKALQLYAKHKNLEIVSV